MGHVIYGSLPWKEDSDSGLDSSYQELAAAIIMQAVKDEISAIRALWNPKLSIEEKRKKLIEKMEIEDFFRSQWYEAICEIEPEKIIHRCRVCAEEEERERIREQSKRKSNSLKKEARQKTEKSKTTEIDEKAD